jgi:hypothetical protein
MIIRNALEPIIGFLTDASAQSGASLFHEDLELAITCSGQRRSRSVIDVILQKGEMLRLLGSETSHWPQSTASLESCWLSRHCRI